MKTKINDARELIGMFVGDDKQSGALTRTQLQNIAIKLGFNDAQVRDNYSMYDCMYDVKRLQIHVDEQNRITEVAAG